MASTQPMNGVAPPPVVNGSHVQHNSQQPSATGTTTVPNTQSAVPGTSQPQAGAPSQPPPPQSPSSTSASRPRDVRLIELLLTSAGVTSYEPRVPLLLLDFAYRHTSSILNDALHLSVDPYTTHAGARPSGAAGVGASSVANLGSDATVSANAVRLAISARLNFQFRGGAGAGGISKEWMQDIARERNRIALPKVPPNEWGVRLPSERFVLSGASWGLRDEWTEFSIADDDEDGNEDAAAMQDHEMGGIDELDTRMHTGEDELDGDNDIEPGTMADVFGDEVDDGMMEE